MKTYGAISDDKLGITIADSRFLVVFTLTPTFLQDIAKIKQKLLWFIQLSYC